MSEQQGTEKLPKIPLFRHKLWSVRVWGMLLLGNGVSHSSLLFHRDLVEGSLFS